MKGFICRVKGWKVFNSRDLQMIELNCIEIALEEVDCRKASNDERIY